MRYVPPELAAPEAQLSPVGNAVGFCAAAAATYGFLVPAVGKARLIDLFESEPMADY